MTNGGQRTVDELAAGVSLDALFRAAAKARPDAPALADPADRGGFADGAPRRLSYAEADAVIERLARRLRALGLADGAVVAVQLPNVVEAVIALLAVLRAGLIAAPVPVLWRRAELVAALGRLEPKALVTLARLGAEQPAKTACEVAAELFSLSFPCAFGAEVPDGVIALDHDDGSELTSVQRLSAPNATTADAIAIATFDATADGYFPVGRTHPQWLAAGLATLLEANIVSGDTIVSTLPPASLAGIGTALVPWLLSGGTLELVHDCSPAAFAAAAASGRAHLVAPAGAVPALTGQRRMPFASCIAVHRAPAILTQDFSSLPSQLIVDVVAFGEAGAVALLRDDRRRPRAIPLGPVAAPSSGGGAPFAIETHISAGGELLLRGAVVPRSAFRAAAASSRFEIGGDGFVRTGFRCRAQGKHEFVVEAGPPRVALVGGVRFGLDDLGTRVAKCVQDARVEAIDDPLLGSRLRIETDSPAEAAAALQAAGHSPLVVEAVVPRVARRRAAG